MKKSMIVVGVAVCMALAACGKESGEGGVDVINFQAAGAETDVQQSENMENTAENQEDASESGQSANDELVGDIESIEDGGFMISKVETEEKDDGAEIAVANLEDKVFVRVTYSASTKFVMCTVIDGVNGQYTDAAASDLEKGRLVNMEGVYEGGEFAAQKITIYDFND